MMKPTILSMGSRISWIWILWGWEDPRYSSCMYDWFLFSKLIYQNRLLFSSETIFILTVGNWLLQKSKYFFYVLRHIDGDSIFGSTTRRTQLRVQGNLTSISFTLPGTVGMFIVAQNFSFRGLLLYRSWEISSKEIFLSPNLLNEYFGFNLRG